MKSPNFASLCDFSERWPVVRTRLTPRLFVRTMASSGLISLEQRKRDADDLIACFEDPAVAFQQFLDREPPGIFPGGFGFPCLPLIGNYSDDYTPALPMVLLQVPLVTPSAQLPPSVAEMVDLLLGQSRVSSVELYAMVHSALLGPQKGIECGYLTCKATDEFNLVLHPWLFAKDHVHDGDAIGGKVHVGIFEPYGVAETHLDRGGVPFGLLSKRDQILHDYRFSPNNCSVKWLSDITDTPVFFSFAFDGRTRRAIVCLHILPVGDDAADRIRDCIKGKETLRELLAALREKLPGKQGYGPLSTMLAPLVVPEEWEAFAGAAAGAGGAGDSGEAPME